MSNPLMPSNRSSLRQFFKAKRHTFLQQITPEQWHSYEQRLEEYFLADAFWAPEAVVGVYWSMPDEVPTHHFICRLLDRQITIALPYIDHSGIMVFRILLNIQELEKSPLGFYQPGAQCLEVVPTFMLVPGLAFNAQGYRLGHGQGHYDRYLACHDKIKTVGVAFECQRTNDFLPQNHDIPMDQVIYF